MKTFVGVLLSFAVAFRVVGPTVGSDSPVRPTSETAMAVAVVAAAARGPEVAVPGSPVAASLATFVAPTLAQLIGQKLVVRMSGTTPTADLLGRIRRGEVGGVILFGPNITTKAALIALTGKLHAAAAAGGQPRLLIAVDQEGGSVRRIPWAPPTLSPPQMGALGSTTIARSQGASTGAALKALGIDVDLAPVADVPHSTASFLYLQGRTWSFLVSRTTALADAFAGGLESRGELPSMKHFPGLGYATRNTDAFVVSTSASRSSLAPGLRPYQLAIGHGLPLIMLSNATYPAYDPDNAAGWSRAIGIGLLRQQLGFRGATVTDGLDGAAAARGVTTASLALRAAEASTDLLLLTGTESSSKAVYAALLRAAQTGSITMTQLQHSFARILALKARL